jgi:hypothetical protein
MSPAIGPVVGMVVLDVRSAMRDAASNKNWLLGSGLLVIVYAFASAAVFAYAEGGRPVGPEGHQVPLGYWKALVFTILNLTCGFAAVVPTTFIGEILAVANAIVGLLIFGLIVAVIAHSLAPSASVAPMPPGCLGSILAQLPPSAAPPGSGAAGANGDESGVEAVAAVGSGSEWHWLLKGRRMTPDETSTFIGSRVDEADEAASAEAGPQEPREIPTYTTERVVLMRKIRLRTLLPEQKK